MATLQDTLSQAEPLERVGWLIYSANWYEWKADRHPRQSASSRTSAAEAREFAGFAALLRQQADIELGREINRRVTNSVDQVRWWQRLQVSRRAARADRELEKTVAAMAEDGRAAGIDKVGAREAPARPAESALDAALEEKAQRLVQLRLSAYATGAPGDAIRANDAHGRLNLDLNRLALKEVAHNELHRNQRTGAPLPGATTSGLRKLTRALSVGPSRDSARPSTTSTNPNNATQREKGIQPRQGNF